MNLMDVTDANADFRHCRGLLPPGTARRFCIRTHAALLVPLLLGDHPKAATYDHLKSGHFEGLRHTH